MYANMFFLGVTMAAKKSDPNAKIGNVPSIGQALNGRGKSSNMPIPVTFVFNALKEGGSMKKSSLNVDGIHDVKTDVALPTVKSQQKLQAKQMKGNDAANDKRRGGY
jgi:hypothetical protein